MIAMLVTFKCSAYANITMFGDVEKKLLRMMDFGTQVPGAIYEFELEDMPVTVAVDHLGVSIHQTGPQLWAQKIGQMEVEFRP